MRYSTVHDKLDEKNKNVNGEDGGTKIIIAIMHYL